MLVRIANREDSDQTASSFMGLRILIKSVYQKINFLISQPKDMLKLMGNKNIYNFTLKIFVYLNLWVCAVCLCLFGRQLAFKI